MSKNIFALLFLVFVIGSTNGMQKKQSIDRTFIDELLLLAPSHPEAAFAKIRELTDAGALTRANALYLHTVVHNQQLIAIAEHMRIELIAACRRMSFNAIEAQVNRHCATNGVSDALELVELASHLTNAQRTSLRRLIAEHLDHIDTDILEDGLFFLSQ